MHSTLQSVLLFGLGITGAASKQWSYGAPSTSNLLSTLKASVSDDKSANEFGNWLHRLVEHDETGRLKSVFSNGSVPGRSSFDDILANVDVPKDAASNASAPIHPHAPTEGVDALFSHLNYKIDSRCTSDLKNWWYRTYDGSCNWLKEGEISQGQLGMPRSRDYDQHEYADGISKPREGPNPRAVSNAFFRRKQKLFYEHTPFMLGLVEFIMHDITFSEDSETEFIEVPMPDDEDYFDKNASFRVSRTKAAAGTGTSRDNPRENANMATTWLDVSSLYGSSEDVAKKLRSFKGGKLLTHEFKAPGTQKAASYLPFNHMGVPTRTRPGVTPESLFAGGDPRTNEDWIMLVVHTLLLREHNRLCDILAKQHPEYDDERLYQTVRVLLSAKFALIGNAYQMAYWTDSMPWPRDDGFPLYREMYGEDFLDINPANTYPWPLVTKKGKPMTVSAEMAVVYRFHEFIIESFPIKDAGNNTIWDQKLFDTGFNASGFVDTGLENILRGTAATSIPNFKSGVDEAFRSAGKYRGAPFDIVTWSIVHEREQGLPTFNTYFRAYNKQDPEVVVPIRERFEDFSTDPEYVASLKRLYKSPDDVDLVVGCQLDEEMFPHTTIPKSALIISLFSLFGMGNSDRFSIGYAAMRCLLVDKPWDCHPSNVLEDVLWKPMPKPGFPNFRFYDPLWMEELDFQAHGTNLLWRLVTENTEVKCLQRNPLFPVDPKTNPVQCSLPTQDADAGVIAITGVQVSLAKARKHQAEIISGLIALLVLLWAVKQVQRNAYPPKMRGWPIVGRALDFQNDARQVLLDGFSRFGSRVFGVKLAALTHYLLTDPRDLKMMMDDNPYEIKFDAGTFFELIGVTHILRIKTYDAKIDIINIIKQHFSNQDLLAELGSTMEYAGEKYLAAHPLVPANSKSKTHAEISSYLNSYITSVCCRVMIGPDADAHPELIGLLQEFNVNTDAVMGMNQMLPSFMGFVPKWFIGRTFKKFRKILVPIISKRRQNPSAGLEDGKIDFLPFILEIIPDDKRVSDLVTLSIWFGLRNLQATLASTILDINNVPGLQSKIVKSLKDANVHNLNTFTHSQNSPWSLLRSAIFESLRLCGTATGPARIISSPTPLPLASDPSIKLPPKQVASLSSWFTHRQGINYGADATDYKSERFLEHDPEVGSPKFISWGLKGPHLCPGRWFALEALSLLAKQMLEKYEFKQTRVMGEDEKFEYHAGTVARREVEVVVKRRR